MAATMSPNPEQRLYGAMLEAGLHGERGRDVWMARRSLAQNPSPLLDVLPSLRRALYMEMGDDEEARFGLSLLSPFRVYGDDGVRLLTADGKLVLRWPVADDAERRLTLATAFPIKLEPLSNVSIVSVSTSVGLTEMRYRPQGAGTCEVSLTLPDYGKQPPNGAPVPAYREVKR
jgi:hypothetical protein